MWVIPPWQPDVELPRANIFDLPRDPLDWSGNSTKIDVEFLGSVDFTRRRLQQLKRGNEEARLFVAVDDRTNRRSSSLSPKTAFPGSGHRLVAQQPATRDGARTMQWLLFRSPSRPVLVLHVREGFGPFWIELARDVLALDRSPWRREAPARVYRFETPLTDDERGAQVRLEALATATFDSLERLDREAATRAAANAD